MALNPIAYTEKVVRSFLRYQLTAYPFADPRLHAQMRALLSLDRTRRSPLLQGPYVSLSRPFRQGAPIDALIAENLLHPHLRERVPKGIAHLYGHQERAIRAIAAGRTTLVSTGTGSGKTECFLYPIVSRCLHLRDEAAPPGISAVIVYPMNALAEDQLMRLRALLAGTGIPFGIYVGKTPEGEAEVAGVRLPAGSSRADYEARLERVRRAGSGETVYPPEEVCSREAMRTPGRQPRILLTNVKQLELLLTRQQDVELFADARLDFLVFDEAHTFTGALGAETACLIRRPSRLLQSRRQRRCRKRPPARPPRGLAARDRRRPPPTCRRARNGCVPRGPRHLRRDLGDHRGPRGPRSRAQLRGTLLRRRARGGGDGRRGLRGRGLGGTPKRPAGLWRGSGRDPRPLRSCRGGRRRLRRGGADGHIARGGSTARRGRTGGGRTPVARRRG